MALVRLYDIQAYNLVTGQAQPLRVGSDGGYMTLPTDDPPHTVYRGQIKASLNFERSLFEARSLFGASKVGQGVLTLSNVDGELDGWADYAFDGRRILVREGERGAPLAGFTTVFSGVVENHEPGLETFILRLRDRLSDLDKPVLTALYAGTNSGPTGVEGGTDLKDKPKQRVYGYALAVPATVVNASSLIVQWHDGPIQSIANPCHMGAPWTLGTDYPDLAALQAATVPAATVATCKALGFGRTGTTPRAEITADIQGDATGGAYVETAAGVIRRLLAFAGLAADDVVAAAFDALAAQAPARIGFVVRDTGTTFLDACDLASSAAMAWYSPDVLGRITAGRIRIPTQEAAVGVIDALARSPRLERQPAKHTKNGLPAWRVTVKYARNWCVIDKSQIATSVSADRVEWLTQEWRTAVAEDATVKTAYPHADEFELETPLVDQADAQALAAALLAILKVRRDFWKFSTPPADMPAGADLGVEVLLRNKRLGLAAGRPLLLTSLAVDYRRRANTVTAWG